MSKSIPAAVIGASGYVGGELLRLVAGHPAFDLKIAVSDSAAGKPVGHLFGHLATALAEHTFMAQDGWLDHVQPGTDLALFSAAPHGASAAMLAEVIAACETKSINLHVVDSSADFRFADQAAWEDVYGQPHGAPQLLDRHIVVRLGHVFLNPFQRTEHRVVIGAEHGRARHQPHILHGRKLGKYALCPAHAVRACYLFALLDQRAAKPRMFIRHDNPRTGPRRCQSRHQTGRP